MPVVSLEKAVEPLVNVVPNIKRMAYFAKEKCQSSSPDKLTLDESASIIIYTMEWDPHEQSLYFMLNATLPQENRQQLKPWFLYLKLVFTALSHLPSQRVCVYRGVNDNLKERYTKGTIVVWWVFSSCTACIEVLENEAFLQKEGKRTIFNIKSDSAKDIQRYSQFDNEDEILLLPGRVSKVMGYLQNSDGLCTIQLKEIKPPHPYINMLG
ncbi:unnamed protein product [Rotaria magnacalcarata]|nr:unnamed protein product [Rotaria magnacalcarata]CAF3939847.1 unnamed protein product [Rotaria magnacalcarata]CAF4039503.1 unnamed protein product [Rotaria magnacalcarata]CAF4097491.1 unnamed protein product [Rotaria magnacalcarata]CAF5202687.1 unnamed protein product [Rotaria magnacalcarata]